MAIPLRIVLIEDDPLQAEYICEKIIWPQIPSADVKYFDSEYSFQKEIQLLDPTRWWPSHALIDLNVRYFSPQEISRPEGVPNATCPGNRLDAGYRCREKVVGMHPRPAIALMSVNDEINQPAPGIVFIQKGDDDFAENVLEFLRRRTAPV